MLNLFFMSKNFIFFTKNGLMFDYFSKKILNNFFLDFFFWTIFLFCEKYVIEFFFKNVLNFSLKSVTLFSGNYVSVIGVLVKTILTLFLFFF